MEKEDSKKSLQEKIKTLKIFLDLCGKTAIQKMNENQDSKTKIETGTQPPKGQKPINFIHEEPKKEETSPNFEKYLDYVKKIDEYKIKLSSIEKHNNPNKKEDKPGKGNFNVNNNNIIKGDIFDKKSKHLILYNLIFRNEFRRISPFDKKTGRTIKRSKRNKSGPSRFKRRRSRFKRRPEKNKERTEQIKRRAEID